MTSLKNSKILDQSAYSFEDPAFYFNPVRHRVFSELRKYDPVSWRPLSESDGYWAVVRHSDIVAISSDPQTYSSAQGAFLTERDPVLGAMITTDPPRHNEMRRSVSHHFNNSSLRAIEGWLRGECRSLVQQAIEAKEVEFVYDVAANLPLHVIGKIMQLPANDRNEMLRLTSEFTRSVEQGQEALASAAEALAGYSLNLAQIRRGKEGKDLISSMMTVGGREQTDAEFATMFTQIAVAATETTRTSLAHIVTEFAKNPELMGQFADDGCDLNAAINEFLRYNPPVIHVRRTATRDHEFAGVPIKSGDKLVLLYPSGNFDEEVFDEPMQFDVTRRPNPHLAFGVGQHLCLGFRLARLELRVFLEEFLASVSKVELLAEPVMKVQLPVMVMHQAMVRLVSK